MALQLYGQNGSEVEVAGDLSADPLIGATLRTYELVASISDDGAGVLYRARHRLLGWERAIKVYPAPPTSDDGYATRRFIREAKLAADLRHPNIVRIYDIGIDERCFYVVMELLDGNTLAELLDEGVSFPLARSLGLLAQVAYALDSARDAGVAHHDLTPTSIVVGPGDHVTVMNFSIASAADATHVTSTGEILGTLAYLAPETILGTGDGSTADQYALGIMAYELLVGHVPFAGDDPTAVMEAHTHQPPPRPREIRPELTEALEQVLLRQLSKDPDERYATATEFAVALRTAVEVGPVRPDPTTTVRAPVPREPDPWMSLQIELQEQHRSKQDQPALPRLPRRRFLATIGTLIAGAGLAAGGVAVWPRTEGGAGTETSPGTEPARPERSLAVDLSVPKLPVLSAVAGVPAAPAARGTMPVTLGLGPGSTLTQGLRMDTMSYYQNSAGNVVVQGLLANPGTDPASIDSFQLAFLNQTGAVVQTAKVITGPLFVQPNARAPWLQVAGHDLPAFSSIRVVIRASLGTGPTSRTQRFDVTDRTITRPSGNDNAWTIGGRASYRGKSPTSSVSVLAAAFDGDGKLLRVGSAFAAITRLAPGESSLFKVTVDAPTEVERYELLVQGT